MARVVVSPQAAASLDRLTRTHNLPADTRERFKRSVGPLERFPSIGRELEGRLAGRGFLLGPWRWMVIVYLHDEEASEVHILTVEDARSSTAATNLRA